jgi:hypothetical protein
LLSWAVTPAWSQTTCPPVAKLGVTRSCDMPVPTMLAPAAASASEIRNLPVDGEPSAVGGFRRPPGLVMVQAAFSTGALAWMICQPAAATSASSA